MKQANERNWARNYRYGAPIVHPTSIETMRTLFARIAPLRPALEAALAPFAVRPHWGKLFQTDAKTLATSFPRLGDFRALVDRLDPAGKFRNAFVERPR